MVLQGVTHDDHLSAVRRVLALDNANRVIVSVAFMTAAGLAAIRGDLARVAKRTTILAGVRNGITSAQSLRASLDLGCLTYVVDTGSRRILFHPKIYFSRNAHEARLVVGSANLTLDGLNSNIEASVLVDLCLSAPDDVAFAIDLENKLDAMITEYPNHVLQVQDTVAIDDLLNSGGVIDETVALDPVPPGWSESPDLDTVSRTNLKSTKIAIPRVSQYRKPAIPQASVSPVTAAAGLKAPPKQLTLVWESKPLMRRHLTIPTASNTNSTGSMLFTQGAFDHIDQRHYFRDNVFVNLNWTPDTRRGRQHLERTTADFHFMIRNVGYPAFKLRLSHNTRTDTRAYEQRNSMTQIHWGAARYLVKREDLLDRLLFLYRDNTRVGHFVIEID